MKSNLKPEYRDIARNIAKDSIVTQALARLIEQIIEEIHTSQISPLRRALKLCEEQLAQCLGPDTEAGRAARTALGERE